MTTVRTPTLPVPASTGPCQIRVLARDRRGARLVLRLALLRSDTGLAVQRRWFFRLRSAKDSICAASGLRVQKDGNPEWLLAFPSEMDEMSVVGSLDSRTVEHATPSSLDLPTLDRTSAPSSRSPPPAAGVSPRARVAGDGQSATAVDFLFPD